MIFLSRYVLCFREARAGCTATVRGTAIAAAGLFRRNIDASLAVKVVQEAVLHHVHEEHFEYFIINISGTEVRGCPKPGRVVNKGNAESNPVFNLHLVLGNRMLAKLDRGLPIRNERLHIKLVVFARADQVSQFVL
jgi:hypothetical protein